jgi:hypothetical protein
MAVIHLVFERNLKSNYFVLFSTTLLILNFRLYWVDAQKDYIASCDLDGKGFKKVLEHHSKLVHPFSVTIHKELVYWDDWEKKAIFMADKNTGKGVVKVLGDLAGAMDMKAFNRLHQVN